MYSTQSSQVYIPQDWHAVMVERCSKLLLTNTEHSSAATVKHHKNCQLATRSCCCAHPKDNCGIQSEKVTDIICFSHEKLPNWSNWKKKKLFLALLLDDSCHDITKYLFQD